VFGVLRSAGSVQRGELRAGLLRENCGAASRRSRRLFRAVCGDGAAGVGGLRVWRRHLRHLGAGLLALVCLQDHAGLCRAAHAARAAVRRRQERAQPSSSTAQRLVGTQVHRLARPRRRILVSPNRRLSRRLSLHFSCRKRSLHADSALYACRLCSLLERVLGGQVSRNQQQELVLASLVCHRPPPFALPRNDDSDVCLFEMGRRHLSVQRNQPRIHCCRSVCFFLGVLCFINICSCVGLVAVVFCCVLSVFPGIQNRNPRASLLTSSIVCVYATYLIGSALLSEPAQTTAQQSCSYQVSSHNEAFK
jgi:hypothetical protein